MKTYGRWVLVFLGVMLAVYVGLYLNEVRWHGYRAWMSERQQDLRDIGSRMRSYAEAHGGILPQSPEELLSAGIIPADKLRFRDHERGASVLRQLRPVPSIDFPGNLIIMIETYDPPLEGGYVAQVLELGGAAIWVRDLRRELSEDDKRRLACSLPALSSDPESNSD